MHKVTVLQQNLLNCLPHENDSTILYTYYHEGRWLSTDKEPTILGVDEHNRTLVEIAVQAVYDDAETMLQAHRENGYNSWKRTVEHGKQQTRRCFGRVLTFSTGGLTMRQKVLTLAVTQECIDRAGRGGHNCPIARSALRAGLIAPRIYSTITGNIIAGNAHDRVNYSGVNPREHQRILDFIRAYDGGAKVAPTTFRIKAA